MTSPKVSVIIPSCGRSSIQTAIESVLSQSISNLEVIIVVDPCYRESIESNPEWWKSIQHEKVRIEFPQISESPTYIPGKISMLRNIGIVLSRGVYIAYLDDDNWLSRDHLEALCAILDANILIDAAYSWRILTDEMGNPLPLESYPWSTRFDNRDKIFQKFLEYDLATQGEPKLRGTVIAKNGDEVFHIDTSELCVRREVHQTIRFKENFLLHQIIEGQGEDRVICEEMYRKGIEFKCSKKYSLFYRVGGYSNVDVDINS